MSACLVVRHHVLRTVVSPRDLSLCSEISVVHDAWCTGKASRSFVNSRWHNAVGCFRTYSTSAESSKGSFTKEASSRRQEVSALLHRISSFLPRALSASTSDGGIQSPHLWHELLNEIDAGLSSSSVSDASQSACVVGEFFLSTFHAHYIRWGSFSLWGRPVGWLPGARHSSPRKPFYIRRELQ